MAPNRRARFWAAQAARVAPDLAECPLIVRSRGTRTSNHLRPRPAPDWAKQGQLWGRARHEQSGAGVEVPEAAVGETQRTTPTPTRGMRQSHRWEDAPRTSTPTPPRRRATAIQPPSWDFSRMKHRPRREWDNPTASQPEPNARLAFALRNRFFNHFALCWARGAGAGVSPDHREPRSGRYEVCERGLSTRFSNHHQEFIRRQPRGSFGINAPDCKQVLPTTSRLRLLGDIHQPSGCREAGAMLIRNS